MSCHLIGQQAAPRLQLGGGGRLGCYHLGLIQRFLWGGISLLLIGRRAEGRAGGYGIAVDIIGAARLVNVGHHLQILPGRHYMAG